LLAPSNRKRQIAATPRQFLLTIRKSLSGG
jgi:hypothetical protein